MGGRNIMHLSRLKVRARIALIACAVIAAALWSIGIGLPMLPDEYTVAIIGGAMTLTVTGAVAVMVLMLWDRDKELLLRALVEASQRAATAETVPLPRSGELRAVPGGRAHPR